MISSIRDSNLIAQTESIQTPSSTTAPPGVETIKQIFNETVSEKPDDVLGVEGFDQAIQDYDSPKAQKIMQKTIETNWKQVQEAHNRAKSIEDVVPQLNSLLTDHEEKTLKSLFSRGYEGHNNLLTSAIYTKDYKNFIRVCMDSEDGSWRTQQDPETLKSLIHIAAYYGQKEILYYLLLQGADLELKDQDGLTVKQAAEKNGMKGLVEFIDNCTTLIAFQKEPSDALKAKIDAINPHIKNVLSYMINDVEGYIEEYKEFQKSYFSEDGKLTEEGKAKKDFAKHGIIRHTETSQGHNGLIIESIAEGSLEKLAAYVKMGASLDTLSIPFQKAFRDPHAFTDKYTDFVNESMRTFAQETKESFLGEDPTLWNRDLGVGKTLLDMAVVYSSEEQDNLDIIAYLMHKGLNPFRTNDEGESAFSMALVKGNFKAALLMMGYKNIFEEKLPQIEEKTLDKAFLILKEGAKMRDPLYVNSSKTRAGIFAAAYLLVHHCNYDYSILSWINFFSFFHMNFMSDELTFREKLNIKSERNLYLPKIIKQIYPAAYKASILEITAFPEYPVGSLGMSALGIYASATSAFSSLKTACDYVAERPLSSMYKVSMDLLTTAQSVMRFKSFFSSFYYPVLEKISPAVPEDYQGTNILQRLDSEKLNPNCREHAKLIFTDNWNQTAFEKDPEDYVNGFADVPPESFNAEHKIKLRTAFQTLLEPEKGSFLKDTAYKGGTVFAATVVGFDSWQLLSKASIFYNIGSRFWRAFAG